MDPRHPEQAISRLRELFEQFDNVMAEIKVTPVSNKLGELERQGSLVIQEICLVAPRLHEAMMQASRTRRFSLSHPPIDPVENSVVIDPIGEEEKPKKKKTSKKKED